jgi:ABC transport system ATP-binding/permease protein
MSVPVVDAKQLHKAYGAHVVLGAVDVTVTTHERVGVVGDNGAGKSTLARIVAGIEPADSGSVARQRGASISYLAQVPRFEADLSAREIVSTGLSAWTRASRRHAEASAEIAAGRGDVTRLIEEQTQAAEEVERLGGWQMEHQVEDVLQRLGITRPDALVSKLSGGEQRRVALAQLLISRPDLAILDEPTNHLDAETIDWLERFLIDEFPGAVLFITHDRYMLNRVAERTLEVAGGQVFSYDGGYDLYLEQKAERAAHAQRTEQNRQNFLRRELEWLRRQPKARSTKQKARIERAESAQAISAPKAEVRASLELDVVRSGKTILELHDVGIERGGRELVHDITLYLTEGDRIGIVGANGIGKTSLLDVVMSKRPPTRGSVNVGRNTKIAYFDQQRSGLDEAKTVYENVIGDNPRIELGGEVIDPRVYLERFAFDGTRQRQPVGSLSGGERARVALARLLRESANLVILDEPTNDLDVATLGALESMLLDYGITAVVVTHDRWFLDRVASSILAFEGDGVVRLYPGNYEAFTRSRELRARQERLSDAPPAPKPATKTEPTKKKKLSHAEERELEALLGTIANLEDRKRAVESTLADPASYAGGRDLADERRELGEVQKRLEDSMQRWEELEAKKG